MRFPKSLSEALLGFYALRYGEEEARYLMTLKGKQRAKHIAMLDVHGSDARQIEAQRLLAEMAEDSVEAIVALERAKSHLSRIAARDLELQDLIKSETDPDTVSQYQLELNDVGKSIETWTTRVDDFKTVVESKSNAHETMSKEFKEQFGERKQELRSEKIRQRPVDLPKTLHAWQQKLDKDITGFFASTFGMAIAAEIQSAIPNDRWSLVEEFSQGFEGTTNRLIESREAAVRLINTKGHLMQLHQALLMRSVISEEFPVPSDPSVEVSKQQLMEAERLLGMATEAVELAKITMRLCENETRRKTADGISSRV